MKKEIASRLGPARVPFLTLPPVCVLLGYATALRENTLVDLSSLLIALAGAVFAHISVNSFNEYADFRCDLDSRTKRTPFSGGSGTLQARPQLAPWTLGMAIGALAMTAAIGLYFAAMRGIGILPIGIAGVAIIVGYCFWGVRNAAFSLIAPGIGFGPLMVVGTYFVLTGRYSWTAALVSLIPFFLVNNLLLLNQFPDIDADRSVGRKNLPIIAGVRASAGVYASFIIITYLVIIAGVIAGMLPLLSLIGIATAILSVPSIAGAFRKGDSIPQLIPAMGQNVLINLLTPTLVAVGMIWG